MSGENIVVKIIAKFRNAGPHTHIHTRVEIMTEVTMCVCVL